jgi:hypothetical protein
MDQTSHTCHSVCSMYTKLCHLVIDSESCLYMMFLATYLDLCWFYETTRIFCNCIFP